MFLAIKTFGDGGIVFNSSEKHLVNSIIQTKGKIGQRIEWIGIEGKFYSSLWGLAANSAPSDKRNSILRNNGVYQGFIFIDIFLKILSQ